MIKRLTSLVLAGMCAAPAFALAESFNDAPLIDMKCSKKAAPILIRILAPARWGVPEAAWYCDEGPGISEVRR